MSSILTPERADQGWVVQLPYEMTQALGVSEGSLAVLHTRRVLSRSKYSPALTRNQEYGSPNFRQAQGCIWGDEAAWRLRRFGTFPTSRLCFSISNWCACTAKPVTVLRPDFSWVRTGSATTGSWIRRRWHSRTSCNALLWVY